MASATQPVPEHTTPNDHLLRQVEHYNPHSLLVAAPDVPQSLQSWADDHHCNLTHIDTGQPLDESLGRHDFAVVMQYLENLDKPTGVSRLGQIRNLYSSHIWVQVKDGAENWRMKDFIGLGFRRLAHFEPEEVPEDHASVTCYGYDLASYNHVRTWNNPRYWANPENWGKYWW